LLIDSISIWFRFDFDIRFRIDSIHSLNLVCNFELDIESLRVVDKFCLPEIPAIARGTGFFICPATSLCRVTTTVWGSAEIWLVRASELCRRFSTESYVSSWVSVSKSWYHRWFLKQVSAAGQARTQIRPGDYPPLICPPRVL